MPIEGKSFFCLATQEVFHVSRRAELGRCATRRRALRQPAIAFAPVNRSLGSIEVAGSPIRFSLEVHSFLRAGSEAAVSESRARSNHEPVVLNFYRTTRADNF